MIKNKLNVKDILLLISLIEKEKNKTKCELVKSDLITLINKLENLPIN